MLTSQALAAARRRTILSSCCGVTGEAVLTDSAVILLYATALCAGDAFALLTTAILPLLNGLLVIPMAGLIRFCNCRKLVLYSNFFALAGYLITAGAAFFPGKTAAAILLSGIMLFSVCQTGFIAGWLPFLDLFIPAEDRTAFLGRMRFCHQLSAVCFLGAVSLLIGKNPRIEVLQVVLTAGAVIFSGRIWFIRGISCGEMGEPEYPPWARGLKMALANRDVVRFSVYTLALNLGSGAVIPLTLLYLKNQRHTADNLLVLLSVLIFSGMMLGYFLVPKIEILLGRSRTFSLLHWLILLSIAGILCTQDARCGLLGTAFFLMLCNGCIAANSVIASSEIMRRASLNNKMMAMALWGAFFYGGNGISRLAAGAISSHQLPAGYSLILAGAVTGAGLCLLRHLHAADDRKNTAFR